MKLKKIASLALAGIMAVSMLAGCSTTGDTGDNDDTVVVPVTGVVEYANDALDKLEDDLSFAGNSWLDSKLNDLATSVGNLPADEIEGAYNNNTKSAKTYTKLQEKLQSALIEDGKTVVNSSIFGNNPASTNSRTWADVYLVSGRMDQESAIKAVIKQMEKTLDTSKVVSDVTIDGTTYSCEYAGEISALKVTNKSLTGESAWVVAVVVEQSFAKASNDVI